MVYYGQQFFSSENMLEFRNVEKKLDAHKLGHSGSTASKIFSKDFTTLVFEPCKTLATISSKVASSHREVF